MRISKFMTVVCGVAAIAASTVVGLAPVHGQAAGDPPTQANGGDLPRWKREPSMTCSTSSTLVTLTSQGASRVAGLQFAQVQKQPLTRVVERNAEVSYNANRYARVSSRAPGVVAEVRKDLGAVVQRGEVVAVVDSIDLGTAKAELLQAIETMGLWQAVAERERMLLAENFGNKRQAMEAENRVAESRIALAKVRQRLRSLGLSDDQIVAVEKNGDTASLLPIAAPFDGIIVERQTVIGEVVESSKPILSIANTSVMWAMIDLTESDLAIVQKGQRVQLTIDGLASEVFPGTLTWISTNVDQKSRMIKARAEFDNGSGLLLANMFGRATIHAGSNSQAVTIPKDAVQWEGCCNVAFVKADEQGMTYQPVRLMLGYDAGDRYEVLAGLSGGETIVTRGSFILKNEILKSAVGAGCCEVDHLKK